MNPQEAVAYLIKKANEISKNINFVPANNIVFGFNPARHTIIQKEIEEIQFTRRRPKNK